MSKPNYKRAKKDRTPPPPETETSIDYFTATPPEVFIHICRFLPPIDLLSLAQVCRLFHQYLASETSTSTNLIWRQCRDEYLPEWKDAPLNGMTERNFTRFLIDKACQICKGGLRGGAKPHFRLMVRCCEKCYSKNMMTGKKLLRYHRVPSQLLHSLPSVYGQFYWIPHALKLYKEYQSLPTEDEKSALLEARKIKAQKQVEDGINLHTIKQQEATARYRKLNELRRQRYTEIDRRVTAMLAETNEDGSPKWHMITSRYNSSAYRKSIRSPSTSPFTNRCWSILRKKIESEHLENLEKLVLNKTRSENVG